LENQFREITFRDPGRIIINRPILKKIANRFGLRQEALSRMTGFSVRAVANWAGGKQPSTPVKRAFIEMDRLLDSLARLMKPKDIGRWLKEPNSALGRGK
jgi:hypothetical protein